MEDNNQDLKNLATELNKRGFQAEVLQGFVACKYTAKAAKIGYTFHGLELILEKKINVTDKTEKGFRVAFA